jgi:hypothetical protein
MSKGKESTREEEKRARGLIEMAHNEFASRTIDDAIESVFSLAFNQGLPWARCEVLAAAVKAVDQVRADWTTATNHSKSYNTGLEEMEAARSDGIDFLASAFKLLAD